jgi:hypothetical protein
MASIITATTTSGLTQSADNSGVLQLASGTGNLVTVPSVTGTAMVSGNMPAFSARAATTQSLPNVTYTKVTLGTEEFDTNSNFASSRFTPTVAGYYIITGSVIVQSQASAVIVLIYKNGSSVSEGTALPATGIFSATATTSAVIYCNGSTDYIELYAYQGSGGSVTIGSGVATQMTGCLVRSA